MQELYGINFSKRPFNIRFHPAHPDFAQKEIHTGAFVQRVNDPEIDMILKIGDRVVSIGDENIEYLEFNKIMKKIRGCELPVRITFRKVCLCKLRVLVLIFCFVVE